MSINRRQFLTSVGFGTLGLGTALANRSCMRQRSAARLSQNAETVRLVAIGDTGTGEEGQYWVAQAMERYYQENPYNLVLLLGDNIYGTSSIRDGDLARIRDVFERPYQPLLAQGVTFRACLGNHDIVTNNGQGEVDYPLFNMMGRYYTFAVGAVQFFALDTNVITQSPEQINWLDQELSQSTAICKIVFGHHPIYSSGVHGSNSQLADELEPILSRHQVQLYLCGHDHNYERTIAMQGVNYLVIGNGAQLRPVGWSEWTACTKSKLGFIVLDISGTEISLQAMGVDGHSFDQVVIPLEATVQS